MGYDYRPAVEHVLEIAARLRAGEVSNRDDQDRQGEDAEHGQGDDSQSDTREDAR